MKKRILSVLIIVAVFSMAMFIFTACKSENVDDEGRKVDSDDVVTELGYTPTPAFDPENVQLNAEGKTYDELDTTTMNDNPFHLPWWDNFPRFSNAGSSYDKVDGILANVAGDTGGFNDQLFTPLMMEHNFRGGEKARVNLYQLSEIYPGGCLEMAGNASCVLAAFHQNEDGTFEIDPDTGNPKIYATHWNWQAAQNSNVNYIGWMGIDAYVNKLPHYGDKLNDSMPISEPKYPDGTSALGYFNSEEDPRPNNCELSGGFDGSWPADPENVFFEGSSDPRNAKIYDAYASKDINGKLQYNIGGQAGEGYNYGLIHFFTANGEEVWTGNCGFHKDVSGAAADWWIEYYDYTFEDLIRKGGRYFWIDNYNGFDYVSFDSIRNGFGDYSIAGFKPYLAEHQEVTANIPTDLDSTPYIINGVNTMDPKDAANFDIRHYMKALFTREYPDIDPNQSIYAPGVHNAWQSDFFMEDPIWNAYMAYKADECQKFAKKYHDSLKAAAVRAGVNPDDVALGGNDVARWDAGGLDGTECEMINTEYCTMYSLQTSFKSSGLPPKGGSAPFYKVIAEHQISRHGVVWYYTDAMPVEIVKNYEFSVVSGMDALANNCMLNWGDNLHVIGTDKAARQVHLAMKTLTPVLSGRQRASSIAVWYSYDSMSSYLTPAGVGSRTEIDPGFGFYGTAHALEELNIPYDVIFDFKKASHEKLKDVKLLFVPSVTSCDDAAIQLLVDYVNDGGHIVCTGENSGVRDGRSGQFQLRGDAKLYNELKKLEATGRVFFGSADHAEDYLTYMLKDYEYAVDDFLPEIKALAYTFADKGVLPDYELDFSTKVRSSLMQNHYNKSVSIDLVNYNLVLETDTLTDNEGGKVTIRPFGEIAGATSLKVICYQIDGKGTYCEAVSNGDGSFTFEVPGFRYYVTMVIKAA